MGFRLAYFSGARILKMARLGLLAALGMALTVPAMAMADSAQFRIEAQPLPLALKAFAAQAHMQLLYQYSAVAHAKGNEVVGELDKHLALEQLLRNSGLEVIYTSDSAATIRPKAAATSTARSDDPPASTPAGGVPAGDSLQLAQATPQQTQSPSTVEQPAPKEKQPGPALQEIVVTGTYLHDTAPITPVTTITQVDLTSQGYTTLADAIFDLPQNFMGAGTSPASNAVNGAGGIGASYNSNYASGINLRGLGGDATLVLLNGRRLAPTAYGGTVDISQIPVSAIDRIEVMTDGASSLYGSDAVAGVVNIITKRDFSGVEVDGRTTGISEGKTPNYGGDLTGGFSWSSGGLMASLDYEKDNPLFARNRSFSDTLPNPWALTPEGEAAHYFASLHQNITERLTLSVDGLATHRTFKAVDNLFANPSPYVATGYADQYNVSPELDFAISTDWTATLVGQWSRENDLNQLNYPPPQDSIGSFPISYSVSYVEPRVDGKLFDLPAGGVRLALGGQVRQEKMNYSQSIVTAGVFTGGANNLSRHVTSAYSELMIPIIGAGNALPFTRELRIDVSGRYDHYSDFGTTTNPKVGISWLPIETVNLHGSYSRSFQAPTLWDSSTLNQGVYVAPFINPLSPTGTSLAAETFITDPNLQPETARSYNFGLTLEPAKGLKIEASYFDIEFSNQIVNLLGQGFCGNALTCSLQDQSALGSFFLRNPSLTQVNELLNNPDFTVYNFAGGNYTPAPYTASDIKAIVTLGNVNAAVTRIRGVDLTPRYTGIDTSVGRFSADLNTSYYLTYRQQVTVASPPLSIDNTAYNPLKFRAKANLGWQWHGWAANARVNFANSYVNNEDTRCPGGCAVSSWTTFDMGLSYAFAGDSASGLGDMRIAVIVTNLFDRNPPYLNTAFLGPSLGYDPVNASPLLRTISVTLSKRWGR